MKYGIESQPTRSHRIREAAEFYENRVSVLEADFLEKALNPVSGNEGPDFLKKIVQVDIPVPPASSKQLAHFVVAGLKDIFGGAFDAAINVQRGLDVPATRGRSRATRFTHSRAGVS